MYKDYQEQMQVKTGNKKIPILIMAIAIAALFVLLVFCIYQLILKKIEIRSLKEQLQSHNDQVQSGQSVQPMQSMQSMATVLQSEASNSSVMSYREINAIMIKYSKPIIHASSNFAPAMIVNNNGYQTRNNSEFILYLTQYLYLKNTKIPEVRKYTMTSYDQSTMPKENLWTYVSTLAPAKMNEFEYNISQLSLDESWDFEFLKNVAKNTTIYTQIMTEDLMQKIVKNSYNTELLDLKWSSATISGELNFTINEPYKIETLGVYFFNNSLYNGYSQPNYNTNDEAIKLFSAILGGIYNSSLKSSLKSIKINSYEARFASYYRDMLRPLMIKFDLQSIELI